MSKKNEALKLAMDYLLSKQIGAHIIATLREALAEQPAQQPVACLVETEQGVMLWPIEDINEAENYCEENEFPVLLYTSPPAQQEPVAWRDPKNIDPGQGCTYDKAKHEKWPHIYTQPLYPSPQRTWAGLTFGQFHNILQKHKDIGGAMGAVEKTLREQNT